MDKKNEKTQDNNPETRDYNMHWHADRTCTDGNCFFHALFGPKKKSFDSLYYFDPNHKENRGRLVHYIYNHIPQKNTDDRTILTGILVNALNTLSNTLIKPSSEDSCNTPNLTELTTLSKQPLVKNILEKFSSLDTQYRDAHRYFLKEINTSTSFKYLDIEPMLQKVKKTTNKRDFVSSLAYALAIPDNTTDIDDRAILKLLLTIPDDARISIDKWRNIIKEAPMASFTGLVEELDELSYEILVNEIILTYFGTPGVYLDYEFAAFTPPCFNSLQHGVVVEFSGDELFAPYKVTDDKKALHIKLIVNHFEHMSPDTEDESNNFNKNTNRPSIAPNLLAEIEEIEKWKFANDSFYFPFKKKLEQANKEPIDEEDKSKKATIAFVLNIDPKDERINKYITNEDLEIGINSYSNEQKKEINSLWHLLKKEKEHLSESDLTCLMESFKNPYCYSGHYARLSATLGAYTIPQITKEVTEKELNNLIAEVDTKITYQIIKQINEKVFLDFNDPQDVHQPNPVYKVIDMLWKVFKESVIDDPYNSACSGGKLKKDVEDCVSAAIYTLASEKSAICSPNNIAVDLLKSIYTDPATKDYTSFFKALISSEQHKPVLNDHREKLKEDLSIILNGNSAKLTYLILSKNKYLPSAKGIHLIMRLKMRECILLKPSSTNIFYDVMTKGFGEKGVIFHQYNNQNNRYFMRNAVQKTRIVTAVHKEDEYEMKEILRSIENSPGNYTNYEISLFIYLVIIKKLKRNKGLAKSIVNIFRTNSNIMTLILENGSYGLIKMFNELSIDNMYEVLNTKLDFNGEDKPIFFIIIKKNPQLLMDALVLLENKDKDKLFKLIMWMSASGPIAKLFPLDDKNILKQFYSNNTEQISNLFTDLFMTDKLSQDSLPGVAAIDMSENLIKLLDNLDNTEINRFLLSNLNNRIKFSLAHSLAIHNPRLLTNLLINNTEIIKKTLTYKAIMDNKTITISMMLAKDNPNMLIELLSTYLHNHAYGNRKILFAKGEKRHSQLKLAIHCYDGMLDLGVNLFLTFHIGDVLIALPINYAPYQDIMDEYRLLLSGLNGINPLNKEIWY
jgi:hypothetical protein